MHIAIRWSLGAAAVALFGAMFAPLPLGRSAAGPELAQRFADSAGLDVDPPAEVWLTILPAPTLSFSGLTLKDRSGALRIDVERLVTRLRLLPLIAGRFEAAAANVLNPVIRFDPTLVPNPADRRANILASNVDAPNFPVSVTGGKAFLGSQGEAIELDDMALSFALTAPGTAAALKGSALWRGEAFRFSALLGRPHDLEAGKESPFTLQLASQSGELAADGELAALPRWQFSGAIKATSTRPDQMARLAGAENPVWRDLGPLALQGAARINSNVISLSGARLEIGDNSLTGAIALQNDEGKPRVVGTLAANALSIAARPGLLPALDEPDNRWSAAPLPTHALGALNMDLRLSMAALKFGQLALSDVAFTSNIQDGRVELTLSSGRAYSGALKARLGANLTAAAPQVRVQAQIDNLEFGALLRDAMAAGRMNGPASGEIDLRMTGTSPHQLAHTAAGSLRLTAGAGGIAGLDIERTMRQSQTQPLSLPAALRSGGRTPFRRAQLNGAIQDGVLKLSRSQIETDAAIVALSGAISLAERSYAIDIDASRPEPASGDGSALRPAPLKLDLTGPWNNPSLHLDAEALIESSPAAAPLKRMLQGPNGSAASPASAPASP